MLSRSQGFSSRHPVLFGLIIGAATILLAGIVVALNIFVKNFSGTISKEYSSAKSSILGKHFGIVRIEGVIMSSEKITDWINFLRDDNSVPGILLRINSPGGAIAPSQEIFQAVKKLASKKPVVVSMGSIAASGGYYAALPAHHIVANPGTLTGSIGVKIELFQLAELMSKVGISYEELASGPYKSAGSSFIELSEEHRKYLQGLIDDMQEQFVEDLATHRNLPLVTAKKLADGKAYTGNQALKLKLIDSIGTMDDALEVLRLQCNLPEPLPLLEMPKPQVPLINQLLYGISELKPASFWPPDWRNLPNYLPPQWQSLPN